MNGGREGGGGGGEKREREREDREKEKREGEEKYRISLSSKFFLYHPGTLKGSSIQA